VSLCVQRSGANDKLAMREVAGDASGSEEAVGGQDVKTGLCLVDVQVCHSGIRYSRDVCQQRLGHDSEPVWLSVKPINNGDIVGRQTGIESDNGS
jgi:hypothetical protein